MPREPTKVHDLKDMKIHEVSLVTAPASPGADILFTKARDVSGEARDDRGRWTSWGTSDLVRGSKGAARQLVRAVSDRAKVVGETVVGRTVSAVRTTRPTGAYPVRGGGVQFDFEHTLNGAGAKYFSSVQIRPEHVAGESKAHRHLQRGLSLTNDILRRSNRDQKEAFGSTGSRFNWFSGRYQAPNGGPSFGGLFNTGGSGSPAPAPMSTDANAPGGIERKTAQGMPVWTAFENEPGWSRGIRGRAPAGPYPLASSAYDKAGGKPYYYNGHFIPEARPDVQRGIERAHDWLAENPDKAGAAKNTVRNPWESNENAFFTEKGQYIPPGNRGFQSEMMQKYHAEFQRTRALQNSGQQAPAAGPAQRLFPPGEDREYPDDLGSVSPTRLFELKEHAEKHGHRDMMQQIDEAISTHARRGPTAGEETLSSHVRGSYGKSLFSPGFAPFLTGTPKCSRRTLDYAGRVAKSKIRRS